MLCERLCALRFYNDRCSLKGTRSYYPERDLGKIILETLDILLAIC